jgi:hypothetical protein
VFGGSKSLIKLGWWLQTIHKYILVWSQQQTTKATAIDSRSGCASTPAFGALLSARLKPCPSAWSEFADTLDVVPFRSEGVDFG